MPYVSVVDKMFICRHKLSKTLQCDRNPSLKTQIVQRFTPPEMIHMSQKLVLLNIQNKMCNNWVLLEEDIVALRVKISQISAE